MKKNALRLGVVLAALWLLLSGFFDNVLLLALGAASIALIIYIAWRMRILDNEAVPMWFAVRAPMYWPWLIWQIVLSNIHVAKVILTHCLHPNRSEISPCLAEIPCTQSSDLGKAIFANSITLTPGTVSVDLGKDSVLVHALQTEGIDDLMGGDMDRRVSAYEGGARSDTVEDR